MEEVKEQDFGYVFAFDLATSSIGYSVRKINSCEPIEIMGLSINPKHADLKELGILKNRRAYKTRKSHQKREKFFKEFWKSLDLKSLESEDPRFKNEFTKSKKPRISQISNGVLLRILLLKEEKLSSSEEKTYSPGEYQISTLKTDRQIKLKNPNGDKIKTSIKYLTKAGCDFA